MLIECSIEIARPIDEVFAFVSDPVNDPLWCRKVVSVQPDGDAPIAPGASFTVMHRPIPLRPARRMAYRLLSWSPPTEICWHEDDGHDQLTITYLLKALTPDTTQFTQHDDARLGAPRLLHPAMRIGIRHDINAQLRALGRHLQRPGYGD